jgi:hypothetical protein
MPISIADASACQQRNAERFEVAGVHTLEADIDGRLATGYFDGLSVADPAQGQMRGQGCLRNAWNGFHALPQRLEEHGRRFGCRIRLQRQVQ